MNIYNLFKNYLKKNSLLKNNDKILLGVSGGPDSLTMLDLFFRLRSEMNIELAVFHLNHLFRKEAKDEAEFVKKVSNRYNIDCYVKEFDVPAYAKENSLSPEQAARNIRINSLFNRAKKIRADKIALAHNKNDLVETVLLNLFRGSSLSGLSGIEAKTKIKDFTIIHPLLEINREKIEKYCQKNNLNPRHDKSNDEKNYTRNKIRHDIIPYIEKEINPAVIDVVSRSAKIFEDENNYLEKLSVTKLEEILIEKKENKIILSLKKLKDLKEVMKRRVLFKAIYKLKDEKSDIYLKHYDEIKKLLKKSSGTKNIDLPDEIVVKRIYDQLIIQKDISEDKIKNYSFDLKLGKRTKISNSQKLKTKVLNLKNSWKKEAIKSKKCLIDYDKVTFPLVVRNRRKGDRFRPLGLNGSKKIKDFFIDEKVPKNERNKIPLVVDANGIIVWVVKFRIDERVKIDKNTTKVLELTLLKEGDENE
ncbi:MAG: tRNA lysidine(34) synthetase TilS [Bacillota bacterium]